MKKKLLAGLLAMVMIVTMLPVSALAAGTDKAYEKSGWEDWLSDLFGGGHKPEEPGKPGKPEDPKEPEEPEETPATTSTLTFRIEGGTWKTDNTYGGVLQNGNTELVFTLTYNESVGGYVYTCKDNSQNPTAEDFIKALVNVANCYNANSGYGEPGTWSVLSGGTVYKGELTNKNDAEAQMSHVRTNPHLYDDKNPEKEQRGFADKTVYVFTLTPNSAPQPVYADYTVKHYLQNLEDDEYKLDVDATEIKSGEVGKQTAAVAKTYPGFTAQDFTQATIADNGSTVVEIYYNRNTYTVTWVNWDDTKLEVDENVKYGATPSFDGKNPTRSSDDKYDYTFKGWDPDPASTKVTGNLTIKAQYEAVGIPDVPVDPEVKAVSVVKTVADLEGNPVTKASAGDVLAYTIEVKNEGNVDLENVKITDVMENASGSIYFEPTDNVTYAAGAFTIDTLLQGETETITYYYLVRIADAGKDLKNTAASELAEEASVIVIPVAELADPGYTVVKTVKEAYAWVGDTIHYTITVKNTSKETIRNLWVVDDMLGLRKHITELKPGEVWERTYEYEVRRSDAGEKLCNHVVVYANGAAVEAESGLTWIGWKLPALNTTDHVSYIIGYDDGTVRPTGTITRAETATIFFRLMTDESRAWYWSKTNTFTDVPENAWYNNAVSTLQAAGVIVDSKYTFRPSDAITRAEFAVMAAQFTGLTTNKTSTFTDVPKSHWAADEIALVEQMGWIEGYPDGTFRPDETITRAEAMTFVNRMLERAVEDGHMLPNMVTWKDCSSSAWYYEDVQEATNSHEYVRLAKKVPGENYCYEEWVKLLKNPDWAALEKTWSKANSK